jgi:tuftelin-interacting protein 11
MSSSSSEEEDDFLHPSADPNADEFADYNPRKRRRTGRDAKESAALGVFGSDSEDEGPRWKRKERNLRGKGMSFVSSGQKKNFDDDEDEELEEDVDMDDEEEEEVTAPRGLGFQTPKTGMEDEEEEEIIAPRGLGFQKPKTPKNTTPFGSSSCSAEFRG